MESIFGVPIGGPPTPPFVKIFRFFEFSKKTAPTILIIFIGVIEGHVPYISVKKSRKFPEDFLSDPPSKGAQKSTNFVNIGRRVLVQRVVIKINAREEQICLYF